MDGNMNDLLRTVAFLLGVVCGLLGAMAVLLLVSVFVDVNLTTASVLQILAGAGVGGLSLWRTA